MLFTFMFFLFSVALLLLSFFHDFTHFNLFINTGIKHGLPTIPKEYT